MLPERAGFACTYFPGELIDLKLSYAYAAVAMLTFGAVGCGKKEAAEDNNTFFTINGEKVSTKEYLDFLAQKTTIIVNSSQGPQLAPTTQTVGFQGLQDLVARKVLLQLAKDQGVLPTDAEVTKELDDRTKQQSDLLQRAAQAGYTTEDIKSSIRFDLAREKLLTKGVVVTPTEVDNYIKEKPQEFTEPARATLLYVAVGSAAKKAQVDKDLAGGQSFQTVATHYSEDPRARETGARYAETDVSKMNPELQTIVNKTAPLKTSAWISVGPTMFVKFYVQSKTPAKPIPITPEIKERVRRDLAIQRGQLSTDLEKKQADKLQASEVTVNQPLLAKMWATVAEQAKKRAAAAAGSATAPAPGGTAPAPSTAPSAPPATTGKTK